MIKSKVPNVTQNHVSYFQMGLSQYVNVQHIDWTKLQSLYSLIGKYIIFLY